MPSVASDRPARTRGAQEASGDARSRARELRILKTIAEALNGAGDVEQALQTTLRQVASLLGLRAGWIWLTDPQTGRFYSAVAQRLPPFLREPVRMTDRSCWCLDAFRDGALTAGNIDMMECSRLRAAVATADRARTRGLRSHASIPLYFGDRPLGIMNVAAPAWRELTRRELDLLSMIASQVGVAIERARLAGESVRIARMEERTGLARQIHDTLAQQLTAIGLHLEAALDALASPSPSSSSSETRPGASVAGGVAVGAAEARRLANAPPPRIGDAPGADQLQRALALTRASLDETRGSMRQLRTSDARPLPEALDALARTFTADTGIRVHLRSSGRPSLPAADEREVLYIAGEALTNIRKHARATEIDVALLTERDRLRLEIADDGVGFDPRARTEGFGVIGMRERAEGLGGRLRITSRPSAPGGSHGGARTRASGQPADDESPRTGRRRLLGTRLVVTLPLSQPLSQPPPTNGGQAEPPRRRRAPVRSRSGSPVSDANAPRRRRS